MLDVPSSFDSSIISSIWAQTLKTCKQEAFRGEGTRFVDDERLVATHLFFRAFLQLTGDEELIQNVICLSVQQMWRRGKSDLPRTQTKGRKHHGKKT